MIPARLPSAGELIAIPPANCFFCSMSRILEHVDQLVERLVTCRSAGRVLSNVSVNRETLLSLVGADAERVDVEAMREKSRRTAPDAGLVLDEGREGRARVASCRLKVEAGDLRSPASITFTPCGAQTMSLCRSVRAGTIG